MVVALFAILLSKGLRAVTVVVTHDRGEVSQVLKTLVSGEETQVFGRPVLNGMAHSVKTVLQRKDSALEDLCEHTNKAFLRGASACTLTANVEEVRPFLAIPESVHYVVALLPCHVVSGVEVVLLLLEPLIVLVDALLEHVKLVLFFFRLEGARVGNEHKR